MALRHGFKAGVSTTSSKICFTSTLVHPPRGAKVGRSTLLARLPKSAGAKLRSQGLAIVEGTINGSPFPRAVVEPDHRGSHWLRVIRAMWAAAGADAGDAVKMEIVPAREELEPKVPADLRRALATAPKARAMWSDITPAARRDWILWIESAKLSETRTRRVSGACDMLAGGKRRVCCFNSYQVRMDKLRDPAPKRKGRNAKK